MTTNKRPGAIFVSGVLVGAAAVAAAWQRRSAAPSAQADAAPAAAPPLQPAPERLKPAALPPQSRPEQAQASALPPQPTPGMARPQAAPPWPAAQQPAMNSGVTPPPPPPQPPQPQPQQTALKPVAPRWLIVFALGFVLAAAALVGVWLLPGPAFAPPAGPGAASLAPPPPPPSASARLDACPAQPVVTAAAAGGKDGRLPLQSDVSGLIAADVASFLLIGKESAAAGRQRDAEVAFLMACRVANQLKGADSVELADAKYQLGWLYARLGLDASAGSAGSNRSELLERAQALYSDSLKVYLAKYGNAHEKSQFAAQGLAVLRQPQAQMQAQEQAQPEVQAKARTKAGRAAPQPTPPSAPAAGAELPAPGQQAAARPSGLIGPVAGLSGTSRDSREVPRSPELAGAMPRAAGGRAGPSFNCAKARSSNEKMICNDAELSLLDRELGRVYARAKAETSNRATFRRQQAHEWQMRESICRDRDCLLRWYAQRNEQLQDDISDAQEARASARVSR